MDDGWSLRAGGLDSRRRWNVGSALDLKTAESDSTVRSAATCPAPGAKRTQAPWAKSRMADSASFDSVLAAERPRWRWICSVQIYVDRAPGGRQTVKSAAPSRPLTSKAARRTMTNRRTLMMYTGPPESRWHPPTSAADGQTDPGLAAMQTVLMPERTAPR